LVLKDLRIESVDAAENVPQGGANVSVQLTRGRREPAPLIVAAYGEDGKLLHVQTDTATAGATIPVTIPAFAGVKTIKAMLWRDLGLAESICPPKTAAKSGGIWIPAS
jgi:hypothetical protein